VTFDPFGDFETSGYLRNFEGSKDLKIVKENEHLAFQLNLGKAMRAISQFGVLEYKDVLNTHKILFGSVYPWAGQDRLATAPEIDISKSGYERMFALPQDIRRAMEYGLEQGHNVAFMQTKPGEVMGSLCHAHPFLDGNGRTIMVLHNEMAYRAGISIDWAMVDKSAYLVALTQELYTPGKSHLDNYLQPFINEAISPTDSMVILRSLKSLGSGDD
jgi:cell filamentation protein